MIKKFSIGKRIALSQKIGPLVLVSAIVFATTFAATGFSGTANAQENKTSMQPQGIQGMQPQGIQGMSNTTNTNIILVHGAWADGSGWSKVIPILTAAGHKVIAVQLPLHSLADDVATVKRAIDHIGGPVILVGHSYGGEVITNAGYNNPNVKGLVYIAAFAPDKGEGEFSFINPAKFPKGLLIKDSGGFIYLNPELFRENFAQDVTPAEAEIMAIAQKPFNQSEIFAKSGPPAWKQLPTWYQVSGNDRMISPDTERMFAKRMNATTISLPASHSSYVSYPTEVAQLILNATKGK
jgi:pimeloyl-ACP methyl ester carboxylesterase